MDVTPVKGPDGKFGIPQAAIDSVNRNKIGLKGPLMTPIGKGHRSLNLALRKWVSLYHCVIKHNIILFLVVWKYYLLNTAGFNNSVVM